MDRNADELERLSQLFWEADFQLVATLIGAAAAALRDLALSAPGNSGTDAADNIVPFPASRGPKRRRRRKLRQGKPS